MIKRNIIIVLFLCILLFAAFFRFQGVNWDQGQHLHPDERFLTMVTGAIQWPKNFYEYLDSASSPLNPHNKGFGFFVYGTFPIFFTKWFIDTFAKEDYGSITLIGRQLSAMVDLGTVVLVFLIGKQVISNRPIITNKYQLSNKKSAKLLVNWKFDNWLIGLFAAFIYAAMVLPIQLSHFYAVDTYLTFFITLSFYLLIKIISLPDFNFLPPTESRYSGNLWGFKRFLLLNILLGISFGLALASKISAVLLVPIIGLGFLYLIFRDKRIKLLHCFIVTLFIISTYLTFRLAQPYLFAKPNLLNLTLNQKVVDNWKQLKSFDDPTGGFPPAVQWITTKPYLFPLKNMLLWGLGLPLGVISLVAVFYTIVTLLHCYIVSLKKRFKKQLSNSNNETIKKIFNNRQLIILTLIILWIILLFIYQGSQFVKALRYFYPAYPFLAIISAYFICKMGYCLPRRRDTTTQGCRPWEWQAFYWGFIGLLVIIYPLSFLSVYSRPHTRVTASEWIYQNIPSGSIRSSEVWDDGLPLSLPTPGFINEKYPAIEFPLYYPDNADKWQEMARKLQKVDYIILTSNRLYGSIMTVPQKYPITNRYYQMLFDGSLGFEKIAEFTSRPNIPIPFFKICLTPLFARYGNISLKSQECNQSGISFVDDYADETFTVYDHPKVIIFKKVKEVDYLKALYQ